MGRHYAAGSLALIVTGALAGCGGGSSGYSLARTQACFKSKGFEAVALTNRALPGSGGNLRISLGPNFGMQDVFIVFGRNAKEANATELRAVNLTEKSLTQRHLLMPRSAIRAGVEVTRNVFYYSDTGPIAQNVRDDVQSCLR
jgi:hypothetical protein